MTNENTPMNGTNYVSICNSLNKFVLKKGQQINKIIDVSTKAEKKPITRNHFKGLKN
jgi:hypothetical protein